MNTLSVPRTGAKRCSQALMIRLGPSVEGPKVVVARVVRYMNDTTFGKGTGPDPGRYNRRVHFGPWL